jgi:succinate dehydrogenase / fumarate reductase, cytochrome b subunit
LGPRAWGGAAAAPDADAFGPARIAAGPGIGYQDFERQSRRRAIMAEAETSHARGNRPLSPHLQIYKPMLTMMMSIAHRITGAGLYFAMLLLAWWLLAAAAGPPAYGQVQWFMGSWIGRLVLFGCTWALMHHLLGGIRHLIWDIGYGFGPTEREWLARATLIGGIVLTLLLWAFGYSVMGLA